MPRFCKYCVMFLIIICSVACAKSSGYVVRIIDGDTVELKNGEIVRMIGVDTPEIHKNEKVKKDSIRTGRSIAQIIEDGNISKKYVESILANKKVKLKYDKKKRGFYQRILAYIYLTDGTFVNKKIIYDGYGTAFNKYNYAYKDEFLKAEKEAYDANRGLWKIRRSK